MLQMDESVLVDSFVYQEHDDIDAYGQPSYKAPKTIEKVRIDRSTVFSKDTNDTKIVATAVIFCYAGLTEPFLSFKEQSKVTFDGKEHVIKKVVYVTEPYSSGAFAYELEVM